MEVFNLRIVRIASLRVAAYIIGALCIAGYRLYVSPLSHIPGHKVAIFTDWYESYFEEFKSGLYNKRIREFHQQYGKSLSRNPLSQPSDRCLLGPIVRINPTEVCIFYSL